MKNNEIIAYESHRADLMQRWMERHYQKGFERFIADGIASPENYGDSFPKVCFILKECYYDGDYNRALFDSRVSEYMVKSNCSKQDAEAYVKQKSDYIYWLDELGLITENHESNMLNYDLAKHLGLGEPWFMYVKVAKWVEILADVFKFPNIREGLYQTQYISLVNMKKSNGASDSSDGVWRDFCEMDADLLREELDMVSPDIIICGGTYDECIRSSLLAGEVVEIKPNNAAYVQSAALYNHNDRSYLVLRTVHPAYTRYSYDTLKEDMLNIYSEVQREKNISDFLREFQYGN